MQTKGARAKRVQDRLRQVSQANRRMYVFLAIVAVIGAWGGHVRIEQRIEARARAAAKAAAVTPAPAPVSVRPTVEIIAPANTRPSTLNALEQATRP